MKLIDKDKIDEILRNLWKEDDGHNSEHRICYNKALQQVQCEIDALEVKEVDLEKEIDDMWNPRFNLGWDDKSLLSMNHEGFTAIAEHFFELGLKAQKGE